MLFDQMAVGYDQVDNIQIIMVIRLFKNAFHSNRFKKNSNNSKLNVIFEIYRTFIEIIAFDTIAYECVQFMHI